MAELNVTQTLRDTIKKYRKSIHLRGDTLSRTLQKNTSYISQLETGKLKTIDSNLLYKIFDELFKDETVEEKNRKIEEILTQSQLKLSEKELQRQNWLRVIDLQERLIPIPESIINYIKEQLIQLNISSEELINTINKNTSLYDSFSKKEIDEMEDNKVYSVSVSDSTSPKGDYFYVYIKFNLPLSYIDDILNGKIVRCNFITLQGIVYNIFILQGIDSNEAYDQAEKFLAENKFYTMLQKQHLSSNDIQNLAPYDLEFQKTLHHMMVFLSTINDRQPNFLNEILDTFVRNMVNEPTLTFSIISKDITPLHKMNDANKKNFIEDFKALIKQYEENSVETSEKIQTF